MKKRILVVEDEHEISLIIKIRLEAAGYEVRETFDGEEGLKAAKEWNPDLILLDLVLPKMSGMQVIDALKGDERYKRIPVIIVTGLAQDVFNVKEASAKADAFFLKPFDSVELMATIADFLKDPRISS